MVSAENKTVSRNCYEQNMQKSFLGDAPSHTRKESSSDNICRACVQPVSVPQNNNPYSSSGHGAQDVTSPDRAMPPIPLAQKSDHDTDTLHTGGSRSHACPRVGRVEDVEDVWELADSAVPSADDPWTFFALDGAKDALDKLPWHEMVEDVLLYQFLE